MGTLKIFKLIIQNLLNKILKIKSNKMKLVLKNRKLLIIFILIKLIIKLRIKQ